MDSSVKVKKVLFVSLLALLAIGFFIYFPKKKDDGRAIKTLEYVNGGEAIRVILNGEIVFEYSVGEMRKWAKDNWNNLFDKPPSFGEIREVDPEHFYVFDGTASLSPDSSLIAFSVNDYAVATNISFVGVIEIENKNVSLIKDKNIGGVQKIFWSPKGDYLAYILDTGRAEGDYLSVDSVISMKKEFTFSEDDVFGGRSTDFITPGFKDLRWIGDEKLEFTTASEEGERVIWEAGTDGKLIFKNSLDNY